MAANRKREERMAHIVIIGAGSGGLSAAYEMDELARPGDRITVVSDAADLRFAEASPWSPTKGADRVEFSVAEQLQRKGIAFTAAGARRVHPAQNRIELGDGEFLDYDFLMITTGPKVAFDNIEGLGPNGYTQSRCHVEHTVLASEAWERFIANPGPIVVGAVQGASCFGAAYESAFAMDADLRRRGVRDRAPMTFVTAEPFIGHLGLGGMEDSRTMLESAMREKNIGWIANASVTRVEPDRMHVTELGTDGAPDKQHVLSFNYSMMVPAFRGIDAVSGIEGLVSPRGFIIIDEFQRNPRYPNIYAAGVAVASAAAARAPADTAKTGYMVESTTTAAVNNIREQIDNREPTHKASWNQVCLASLGGSGLSFVALPHAQPGDGSWFSDGKWTYLARCTSCDAGC
ncbi:MAG: pyridine nucleotide-disulfide oxidoreductase [Betaproteobacteria bacterium RIFCSPLOWO2_02_FULL_63_19]|nr:MAG: pyridine nucleotide-disulfide oxidoreductase [Betaproteobacteria bacterium RIFCSPLOWO2_02_FULL_63_19]